jgi:hypothetical protein
VWRRRNSADAKTADVRSDITSFDAVLYEMVTGRGDGLRIPRAQGSTETFTSPFVQQHWNPPPPSPE